MKRIPLFMALIVSCCWLAKPCQAQTLDELFYNLFEPLDKSQVQSGLLIHQTPIILNPSIYDGQIDDREIPDSLKLNFDQFGLLYGQFIDATVGDTILPDPKIYMSKRESNSNEVAFALMVMEFDYIREDAVERNLVEWKGGQMHDVPNRPISPYLQDTCFAFSTIQQKIKSKSITFNLPKNLIFNNLGWDINTVEIDFNNGEGFQVFHIGKNKEVEYQTTGVKDIVIKYSNGSSAFKMVTSINIINSNPLNGNRENIPYTQGTHDDSIRIDDMEMFVFSACDDGEDYKLRKPLIILEAFGGESDFSDMFELLTLGITADNEILLEWLNTNEYDLIWVDYLEPFASIETNADNFIKVIDWVNARKHADGSNESNTIIGASMGGLVTKLALLKMHNEQDKNAETERFFSYDTPFQGANYPIGIQAFVRDMLAQIKRLRFSVSSFADALEILDSDASKELIKERVAFDGTTFSLESTSFDALQSRITQLESIFPFSAITRHIAISNGGDFGELQENIDEYMTILNMNIAFDVPTCAEFEFDAHAYAATSQSILIYYRLFDFEAVFPCLSVQNEIGITDITEEVSFALESPMTLDNAPGGMQNIGLPDIVDIVDEGIINAGQILFTFDVFIDDVESSIPLNSFCFIPTISSLNMPPGTDISTPSPIGGTAVKRWTTSTDDNVESPYSSVGEFNQKHVTMNSRIAELIVDELEPPVTSGINGVINSGEIYNFGKAETIDNLSPPLETPRVISENLTIQNNAELWINRVGMLGYNTNPSYPDNNDPQQFWVSAPGLNCDVNTGVTITVDNGGAMRIGEYDNDVRNIGNFSIRDNSQLTIDGEVILDKYSSMLVENGSTVDINPASFFELRKKATFTIQNNSKLHIKTDSRLRLKEGAQIIIEDGGILEIDEGANIDLFYLPSNIHIKEGGEFIINGSFNFAGYGFFQFDKDHIFTQNAPLILSGQGDRFILLNEGAKLNINQHGIDLSNGKVEYQSESAIQIGAGASVDFNLMSFQGIEDLPANNTGVDITDAEDILIINCRFENLSTCIQANNSNANIPFNIWSSEFRNFGFGVAGEQTNGIFLKDVHFISGNSSSAIAVYLEDMKQAGLVNGTITGFTPTAPNTGAITVKNVNNLVIAGTNILENTTGILLEDVEQARIFGGQVKLNTEVGIHIPPLFDGTENETNVFLSSNAQVYQNNIGVYFEAGGGEYPNSTDLYGMLTLDCADFYNNSIGIQGEDIILNIDAYLNSNQSTSISSNKFHGTGLYFDVCYVDLGDDIIGSTIPASGNYWGGTTDPADLWSQIKVKKSYVGSGCPTLGHILDLGIMVEIEPSGCAVSVPKPEKVKCALLTTIPPVNAVDVNKAAYSLFRSEVFTAAKQEFEKTASVSSTERINVEATCKNLINISKVMAHGDAPVFNYSQPTEQVEEAFFSKVVVFPNPAKSEFSILFNSENFELIIYDARGRKIFTNQFSVSATINTNKWQQGMYILEFHDLKTKEILREKIMVIK